MSELTNKELARSTSLKGCSESDFNKITKREKKFIVKELKEFHANPCEETRNKVLKRRLVVLNLKLSKYEFINA